MVLQQVSVTEPCPRHLKFFFCQLAHLSIPSWLSLWLNWVDASNFGGVVHACKHFTCTVGLEGEVPFLSPGDASMQPPETSSGLPLRSLLGWSLRGQGHDAWLGCGAANGLARQG